MVFAVLLIRRSAVVEGGRSEVGLRHRPRAPIAWRGAEPLLEDAAKMSKVTEAPRERDITDVAGRVGGIGKVALAAFQTLHLDVAAERNLFVRH